IEHAGAVATITLSRPPVNAIDPSFVVALNGALDQIDKANPTLVVIRSDQQCFCAGADLSLIRGFFATVGGVDQMVEYVISLHAVFNRLEAM
ncbi:enoyl-CoA hydratase-related protein, partial [Acinetobacter baumannii]